MNDFRKMQKYILDAAFHGQEGHIPSALSILDIILVLYESFINIQNPNNKFILSKGHGCLALYAALVNFDYVAESELLSFGSFTSTLGGHPDRTKIAGVEASTGSLGHGLPLAVGMAWSRKLQDSKGRIFVLIGDGEANEGSIWESALLASEHNTNNLVCVVDYNNSTDRAVKIDPLGSKFESFGWEVLEIDGHNQSEIKAAFEYQSKKPLCIIAKTRKGNGIPEMVDNPAWHHSKLTQAKYTELIDNL
jgi:transketolase